MRLYAWLQLLVKTPNNGIAASNTNICKKDFYANCLHWIQNDINCKLFPVHRLRSI